jgi:hypothetical protein
MAKHAGTDKTLLAMALVGYEAQIAKIDAAIREIQARLGHQGPGRPRVVDGAAPAKHTMSAAGRRRIAAAQRARWAAAKKQGKVRPKLVRRRRGSSARLVARRLLPLLASAGRL